MKLKILVIRFSSMGDVLLTTPVLRQLNLQLKASIYILTKDEYADILKDNPYIEKIFTRENYRFQELKNENFDHVIDLQKNLASKLLSLTLRAPTKSYQKLTLKKWLFLMSRNKRFVHSHVVDRYIETVRHLDVKDDGQGLDFIIENLHECKGYEDQKKTIVLSMGGTYVTKRIPFDLAKKLTKNSQYNFILIGGKDVVPSSGIADEDFNENVRNMIGKTTFLESAKIIARCDLVISGDTGMMHLAAALQKPLIVVWGSTSPDFGFYPYYGFKSSQQYRSIRRENLTCSPCSKYGRKECPKGHMNCLNQIQIHEINKTILDILR